MCCQVFETKSTIESEAYMIKRPLYYRRIEFDPFLENLFLRFKFYHFGNITLRHQPQVPASHQLGTVGRYYVTIMISKLCVTNVSKIVAIADHRSPITDHRSPRYTTELKKCTYIMRAHNFSVLKLGMFTAPENGINEL